MNLTELLSGASIILGALFFCAGTIGLLRFPDVYTRLHALTKADNVGLAFIVFGLALQAESWWSVAKLVLIWGLVMLSGTTCCTLVAQVAYRTGIVAWSQTDHRSQLKSEGGSHDR